MHPQAQAAGISWPLPAGLDDESLEEKLFSPSGAEDERRPVPTGRPSARS